MPRPHLTVVEPDPLTTLLRAVREAQAALAAYVEPGGPGERDTINRLLGALDHGQVVGAIRQLHETPPSPTIDLISGLAETAAAGMIANYTPDDWQDAPEIDELRRAAGMLRAAGREVPNPVREVLAMAEAARR